MTDTLFADISEFQVPVDDHYPYKFLSIRSNDGTYRDKHFAQNYAWAKTALTSGRLTGLIVYFVWRTNWQECGEPPTRVCAADNHIPSRRRMIHVESWEGQIKGDQSKDINAARDELVKWYGGDKRRVIGYGNSGDLTSAVAEPAATFRLVRSQATDSNPSFPYKLAHQFADNYSTAPFGPCDINSSDGLSPAQLAARLGLA